MHIRLNLCVTNLPGIDIVLFSKQNYSLIQNSSGMYVVWQSIRLGLPRKHFEAERQVYLQISYLSTHYLAITENIFFKTLNHYLEVIDSFS